MSDLSKVNRKAYSGMGLFLLFMLLQFLAVGLGRLVWHLTQDLRLALAAGGGTAIFFWAWWFLYQWRIKVRWLCRLQVLMFGAGALPNDHKFMASASPFDVDRRIDAVAKTASQRIQEFQKNLSANRNVLDKYLGAQASKQVLKDWSASMLGGEVQNVFILFSDIRGFTQMTEKMSAKETLSVLNSIYSSMADVIERNGGEINKYIGDAILAYFSWSEDNQRREAQAVVRTALEMQKKFYEVRASNEHLNFHMVKIGLGIGVAAGQAILGNLGSSRRMEYTLIGDSVNLASRLCSIAPEDEVLVNETLAMLIKDKFHIESRMPVQLKGKTDKVTPYCILGALRNAEPEDLGVVTDVVS